MPPELNLLLAAIKADFVGLQSSDVSIKNQDSLDVQRALELAAHHGCIWEVVAYCKFHHLFNDEQAAAARLLTMQSTMYAMRNEQALIVIARLLSENEIDYVAFKGATIHPQFRSISVQQSRQSADIDLLINPRDIVQAVQLLLSAGYQCNDGDKPVQIAKFVQNNAQWCQRRDLSFSMPMSSSQDEDQQNSHIYIDLHWQVAYSFSLPMQTIDLLSRSELVDILGKPIKCLSFNDHFVLLCIHGYLDQFFILKHLADIYWAIRHPKFDINKINSLAEHYGVKYQVESSCAAAELFFGVEGLENDFAQITLQRYQDYLGQPPRKHLGQGDWKLSDKVLYIQHQIRTRSCQSSVFSPLIHRLKYDIAMINAKPKNLTAWLAWPIAYIKKVLAKILNG